MSDKSEAYLRGFGKNEMNKLINKQQVQIIQSSALFDVLKERGFSTDDETRKKVANATGGKIGTIRVAKKYTYDYFFFYAHDGSKMQSLPYEAVDFTSANTTAKLQKLESEEKSSEEVEAEVKELMTQIIQGLMATTMDLGIDNPEIIVTANIKGVDERTYVLKFERTK